MKEAKRTRNNKQGKIFLQKNEKRTPNLHYSKNLEELPVNIIISISTLKELAIDYFEVILKN